LQEFKGYTLIQIRKRVVSRDGVVVWTKGGISLHPEEARNLLELLPGLLEQLEDRATDLHSIEKDWSSPPLSSTEPETRISLQDQVLLRISDGSDPEDVRIQVLGDAPEDRKRFTEIGKALRRCGLLEPRQWILTPLGQAKAMALRRKDPPQANLEAREVKAEKSSEIPPFPGGVDFSGLL
jgi:hypothetical protein